jgi:hypothetical protein
MKDDSGNYFCIMMSSFKDMPALMEHFNRMNNGEGKPGLEVVNKMKADGAVLAESTMNDAIKFLNAHQSDFEYLRK